MFLLKDFSQGFRFGIYIGGAIVGLKFVLIFCGVIKAILKGMKHENKENGSSNGGTWDYDVTSDDGK